MLLGSATRRSLVDEFRAKRALAGRGAASNARRDRGEQPQRVLVSRCGPRDGLGAERRRVRAVRRCSGWRERARAGVRMARDGSVAGVPRSHRDHDVAGDPTAARGGRRRAGWADDRERVRRPQHRCDEAQRRHAQPVATRANAGWFVGGQRGRGGRWSRHACDRRRRRRIHPHSRGLHRAARHEGNVRAHPARSRRVVPSGHGRARLSRPFGTRRGALLRRVCGLRPDRSFEPPEAHAVGSRSSERTS